MKSQKVSFRMRSIVWIFLVNTVTGLNMSFFTAASGTETHCRASSLCRNSKSAQCSHLNLRVKLQFDEPHGFLLLQLTMWDFNPHQPPALISFRRFGWGLKRQINSLLSPLHWLLRGEAAPSDIFWYFAVFHLASAGHTWEPRWLILIRVRTHLLGPSVTGVNPIRETRRPVGRAAIGRLAKVTFTVQPRRLSCPQILTCSGGE